MSKLYRYINENISSLDQLKGIKSNIDSRVLHAMNKNLKYLERELYTEHVSYIKFKRTHKDRRAKDTNSIIHNWINDWFEKKFGWRARSEYVAFANLSAVRNLLGLTSVPIMLPTKVEKIIWSLW